MSQNNYKLLTIAFPIVMLFAILILTAWFDYKVLLEVIGVPAWETLFFDLEQIISAAKNSVGITAGKSGAEIVSKAWLPFSLLPLSYLSLFGWVLAGLFLSVVYSSITYINKASSIYIGLLLCSYATWFALERGQPDLIIFCLVGFALNLKKKKIISMSIFLYASILKFFPLGTIILFWDKNFRKSLIFTSIFLMIFIFFFWLDRVTIFTIIEFQNEVFGGLTWKSFGSFGIFNLLNSTGMFLNNAITLPASFLGPSLCIGIFLVIGFLYKEKSKNDSENSQYDFFLAGSILFIASFVIGRNFDYKLVFLLFCIPFLFERIFLFENKKEKILSYVLLVAIFICFWSGLLGGDLLEGMRDRNFDNSLGFVLRLYLNGFNLLKELLTWFIFAGLSYFTIQLLPAWFGQTLNLSIFRAK